MIKVPIQLTGLPAHAYIYEIVKNPEKYMIDEEDNRELLAFYMQSFSMDMLVNSYGVYDDLRSGADDDRWRQKERDRLFADVDYTSNKDRVIIDDCIMLFRDNALSIGSYYYPMPATLNDFVTICNNAKIKLTWRG